MDKYGSRYKCDHSRYECPYKDCNYHVNSTGKYSHVWDDDDIQVHLPRNEEEAKRCISNLDI